MDDVLAAADINVFIVASRNLYPAKFEKNPNNNDKTMQRIIKSKHFCWTVKCILQFNDSLDLIIEGVGIKPATSHACGIWELPAWQWQKMAWSVVKQTSPSRSANTQMTSSLNLPLYFYHLKSPQSLGRLPKDKLVLELISHGNPPVLLTARSGWVGWAQDSTAPQSTALSCPLQRHNGTGWQTEVFLLPFLSFSTCRKEMEKTWPNPLRSLFWKGKSGSCSMGPCRWDSSVTTSVTWGTGWPSA